MSMLRIFHYSLLLVTLLAPSGSAFATLIRNVDANGNLILNTAFDAFGGRYPISLDPFGARHVGPGAGAAEFGLLGPAFPGWAFANSANAANGEFQIVHYDVDIDRSLPNDFTVNYVPGAAGAPPGILNWIQFVDTNRPVIAGLPRPYLDPQPNDDPPPHPLPFYWTEAERVNNTNLPGGVALRFTDQPSRPLDLAPVDWEADLFLASWNGIIAPVPGRPDLVPTVTIFDGLRWGFEFQCVRGRVGANVSGGVAGDKYESTGVTPAGEAPFCSVPEPGGLYLVVIGIGALVVTRLKRTGEHAKVAANWKC